MTLNANHRCDRCGAQAYATALIPGFESLLLFCAHHWRKHSAALRKVAEAVHDETGRLTEEVEAAKSEGVS